MIILKSNLEEVNYQYVTIKFLGNNSHSRKNKDMSEFLTRAIKSYYSIESVLDKEELFDLLAYNFTTKKLHFLIHATNSHEINEFVDFIRVQYRLWSDQKIDFYIHENKTISGAMLLNTSAHIHTLNKNWKESNNSSLRGYLYDDSPTWLARHHIRQLYGDAVDYYEYLKIYNNKKFLFSLRSLSPAHLSN